MERKIFGGLLILLTAFIMAGCPKPDIQVNDVWTTAWSTPGSGGISILPVVTRPRNVVYAGDRGYTNTDCENVGGKKAESVYVSSTIIAQNGKNLFSYSATFGELEAGKKSCYCLLWGTFPSPEGATRAQLTGYATCPKDCDESNNSKAVSIEVRE